MILEFKKHNYVNVDEITGLRWIEPTSKDDGWGIVFIGGQKMSVEVEEFSIIEKAFNWQYGYSLYDKNLQKKKEGE